MHEIKLVVFDLAGTTIQDAGEVSRAFLTTLENHGIPITEDALDKVRGASKREIIRSFVPSQSTADRIYFDFRKTLASTYESNGLLEIPGATETFFYLKEKGIKVALNTGFDRMLIQIILASVRWQENLIDTVVCGDDVPQGRPAPDMILHAMDKCGVRSADAVANIGDTVLDLRAGHNARVRYNMGVLSGAHTKEQLEREPHSHIIQSVASLPTLWT